VAEAGGKVVVQDPSDALVSGMPSSALAVTKPDVLVPIAHLADALTRLLSDPVLDPGEEAPVPAQPDPAEMELRPTRPDGPASGFTCPECSGALWEIREGEGIRYRCRVGHAYSDEAVVEAQGSAVEAALWAALEVPEERGELLRRIADRTNGQSRTGKRFRDSARVADDRAAVIRRVLSSGVTA
jgi:two-component system chemotaxis response regulator CheB